MVEPILFHGSKFLGTSQNHENVDMQLCVQLSPWSIPHNVSTGTSTYNGNNFGIVWSLLQPHFWKSVRMTFTLLKWGLGSPPKLPKLQSSIAGVKTPCLKALFLLSLESYRRVNFENGLAWAIWTSIAQVMAKRRVESQTGSLTPNH